MNEMIKSSAYFGAVLTLGCCYIGVLVNRRFKSALLNPTLIATVLCIGVLCVFKIDYASYNASAKYVSYLLTPATVSLSIGLYQKIQLLKQNPVAILLGIAAGIFANLLSIAAIALILGLGRADFFTLLPKSITTAIGMPLAEGLGGYGSIAAVIIIITGIVGNALAPWFLKLIKVTDPIAKGIAVGSASHVIGTARALEMGKTEGAMSSLAVIVSGLITVALASVLGGLI